MKSNMNLLRRKLNALAIEVEESIVTNISETVNALEVDHAALQEHADNMAEGLKEAVTQIEYLHIKFKETGSGNTVISRSNNLLTDYETFKINQ